MYKKNYNNHRFKIKKINLIIYTILIIALMLCLIFFLSGCAMFKSGIHDLKGSIYGNEYIIDTFDNFGLRTLRTHGERIDIDNNIVSEHVYNNGSWGKIESLSSVISITIDGNQIESCGDTCIFYDTRLKPDYEFYLNTIESNYNTFLDSTYIAGQINAVKNAFGKPMVVIIKSQTGAPIYAFSGESVYWEVVDDLPKFTKLMIDNKALYIHRANFQIIDKELID